MCDSRMLFFAAYDPLIITSFFLFPPQEEVIRNLHSTEYKLEQARKEQDEARNDRGDAMLKAEIDRLRSEL